MKGQAYQAAPAIGDVATIATKNETRAPPPVEEQDRLFAALKRRVESANERTAEDTPVTLAQFPCKIDHLHYWERSRAAAARDGSHALRQLDQLILSTLSPEVRRHVGRCTSEH